MKAAIYCRVSTLHQDYAMQQMELTAYAVKAGWDYEMYKETGTAKHGANLPELDRLMAELVRKRFDIVLAWKLDRFGRSVIDLSQRCKYLDEHNIRLVIPNQGIDTKEKDPSKNLLINILASVAEFERALIAERTSSGKVRYLAAWKSGDVGKTMHSKSGKNLAPWRPKKIFPRDKASQLRAAGMSWRKIGATLKVPWQTVRLALMGVHKVPPS